VNGRAEIKWLIGLAAAFLILYFLPVGTARFDGAVIESFQLGPASAFLYSGPAINALAIILTARILGFGIVATPALVVDGSVKIFGQVPTTARIKEILAGAGAIQP
jgi:uncharacterized membrane protein YraQ (UPF0718 family)